MNEPISIITIRLSVRTKAMVKKIRKIAVSHLVVLGFVIRTFRCGTPFSVPEAA